MSKILDDVKRLRGARDCAENCYECGQYGDSDEPHLSDCRYRVLPRLVALVEAAERLVEGDPSFVYREDFEAYQALVAALGEGVTDSPTP